MRTQRLPKTDSIRKLAAFWDTHDLTDYEGELEEVAGTVFESKPSAALAVELKPAEAAVIKRLAKASRIGCKPLLRKWIVERIRQETAGRPR